MNTKTDLKGLLVPLLFPIICLMVDWASFFLTTPALNVTPWNPPAGIYVAFMLLGYSWSWPLTFLTLMIGDVWIRGTPADYTVLIASNLLVTCCYGLGTKFMRKRLDFDVKLDRLADVGKLVIGLPILAAIAAFGFLLPYVLSDQIAVSHMLALGSQYFVGDVIGALGLTPLLLLLVNRQQWYGPQRIVAEDFAQIAALAAAIILIFSKSISPDPVKMLFVLFLPIIWIAMRRGLFAITIALFATQIGIVITKLLVSGTVTDMVYLQAGMMALAATGLLVGAVVSERWRLEESLAERRAELTRVARLSLLGEMASGLAHELNQPLFTTMGYAKAAKQMMAKGAPPEQVADMLDRTAAEADRAAKVLKSVRGFLRQDGHAQMVDPLAAIQKVLSFAGLDASRARVQINLDLPSNLPKIWIDPVLLDQVLLNLIRNAVDALSTSAERNRHIFVSAKVIGKYLEFSVTDNGPGVPSDKVGPLFDLFFTTKPSGMGLGLPICRSIIEGHGGRLWLADNGPNGARFNFTLPVVS